MLLRDVGVLVTCDAERGGPLGLVRDAAVLCRGARIEYVGPEAGLPPLTGEDPLTISLDGCVVTPGLIDCHTHLVFAGTRLDDFEARLRGDSYSAIAARGGGILSTVDATRAASNEELQELMEARVEQCEAHGVTTVEVKSGYGLDTRHEFRLLDAIKVCNRRVIADLVPTFLGAHVPPADARVSSAARAAYVERVISEMLPEVARRGLARFCDVFIDEGAFTLEEGRRILEAARSLGLGLKVHAEQLAHTGAAGLAAELGAVSAEHLERISDEHLAAMAEAGTVAVMLPGASFFLRDGFTQADRFRSAGVKMAVATDWNPGTSPADNLLLMAQMAVLGCGLTIEEALLGVTLHAAHALDLGQDRGMLRVGMRADLAMFRIHDPRELIYQLGSSPCSGLVKNGRYLRVEAARPGRIRLGRA
ncbi:MAG: imidazolonepropionase [Rickettsiales bacterium]|nr:imidazolonepropionase [Rickettsiales bacterium]